MIPAGWLNSVWMLAAAREAGAFRRATRHVARTQATLLADIVRVNCNTVFGRTHGFRRIDSPSEFQRRVPLSGYDDYTAAIQRIAAGNVGELMADAVETLQPTSGSTGGEKLIPYTATLRRQFQRAV